MLIVLYFQKIKNRVYCKLLASFVVYTVWFPLRENQENCVTKRPVFVICPKEYVQCKRDRIYVQSTKRTK